MNDELRDKAERMVFAAKATQALMPLAGEDILSDAAEFARIFLAEHPADDEEPWDEAWLRNVGFQTNWREDGIEIGGGGQYVIVRGDGAVTVFEDSNAGGETLYLRHIKTRGQVRRLCAVLEIPLKEQP